MWDFGIRWSLKPTHDARSPRRRRPRAGPRRRRMILPVHQRLRAHLAEVLVRLYALDEAAAAALTLDYPPSRDLGDLGTPLAFELARRLRKAPRVIAQEIAAAFGTLPGVKQVSAAPNGYLNVHLDRPAFLLDGL